MEANGPSVVEDAHPKRSRASFVAWPLRWKVAAIMILPVLLAATFGALRIQSELSAAAKLSVASGNVGIVVPAVEFVDRLDGLAYAAASGQAIEEPLRQFDASAAALASLTASAEFDPAAAAGLVTASSTAKTLRDEIASGLVPQVRIAEQTETVATGVYSAIATTMAPVGDNAVQTFTDRLVTVLTAQRSLTTQRVLSAAPDFGDSVVLRTKVAKAAGAEAAAIDRLAQLTPSGERAALPKAAELSAGTPPLGESVDTTRLTSAMRVNADQYHAMAQQLSSDLERTVHDRANALRSAALRDTAIVLGAVLFALVVALAVARSLIRSIGGLRRGALQVAQVQLPDEIERLSKGGGVPEITALPVDTKEELGQLARAIDDIHFQAVRLASEHGVRLQIGEMFETLSRRSRSLVDEQLALIETLELDEDDPDRLDHLFRLDHLVTRMRRNGDNLLVLAGTVERHLRPAPESLPEVLRAAMSEVEEYRRVTLGPSGDISIVGAAAADVGHLVAELLDNALRYSPPESSVLVTVSRAVDAGVLVEVADWGIGMPAEDLTAANERLALGGEVTSETAKRMGLFVVGRLARRHDATVRLRTTDPLNAQPGVTASVYLPGALIAPPSGVVPQDPIADPVTDAPLAPVTHLRLPDPEPDGVVIGHADEEAVAPAPSPTSESNAVSQNGNGLPKRSPGASRVTEADESPVERSEAPTPRIAAGREPAQKTASNSFSSFANRSKLDPPPTPDPESAVVNVESENSPIFERMASEWLMDPTTLESRDGSWMTAPDAGWAAATNAADQKPERHNESGLPVRERGARLVPGQAGTGSDADTDVRRDPSAVGDILSRALAGVRSGRAESTAAERENEGDQ
jgi:signal transduction histidine kinase